MNFYFKHKHLLFIISSHFPEPSLRCFLFALLALDLSFVELLSTRGSQKHSLKVKHLFKNAVLQQQTCKAAMHVNPDSSTAFYIWGHVSQHLRHPSSCQTVGCGIAGMQAYSGKRKSCKSPDAMSLCAWDFVIIRVAITSMFAGGNVTAIIERLVSKSYPMKWR